MSDPEEEPKAEPEGVVLSPRQMDRQFSRIKNYLLANFEELEDDSYRGDLKPEVRSMFESHIPIGEVMDEDQLQLMIASLIAALVKDIIDNVRGVDANVATVFAMDFVGQCLEVIYSLEFTDNKPDNHYDPAYG